MSVEGNNKAELSDVEANRFVDSMGVLVRSRHFRVQGTLSLAFVKLLGGKVADSEICSDTFKRIAFTQATDM